MVEVIMPDVTLPKPVSVPNSAHTWASPAEWLIEKLTGDGVDPVHLIETFILEGYIDNDAIEDVCADAMEDSGYFLPTFQWMLGNANPDTIEHCPFCTDIFKRGTNVLESDCQYSDTGIHTLEWLTKQELMDWCENAFAPMLDGRQEFFELGKEMGWWK